MSPVTLRDISLARKTATFPTSSWVMFRRSGAFASMRSLAVEISAYTLVSLSRAVLPLFTKAGGGSVMTLTYNAVERVVPSYNSMAIAKAALETCVRYLAVDLGPSNVRVNAISAGPLKTLSASAVKGISTARDLMEAKAPLRRNITQEEVGNVAVFLASEMSRSVTGDTIYADNGVNIVGVTD